MKRLFLILIITVFTVFPVNGNDSKLNSAKSAFGSMNIPPRAPDAIGGTEFMESVKNMSFADRESAIEAQLLTGNLPQFMRNLVEIESSFTDVNGNSRTVRYSVMPDYLAIGSDSDYCRIPMGPITAQTVADAFGAIMPTRQLVDDIYIHADIKLQPVTYAPIGDQNSRVEKFIEHNTAIQSQFNSAGGVNGQLVGGTKKDVVISNRIVSNPDRVVIYGWHQLNGSPIQPLYSGHVNYYVDYSHGIRLIDSDIIVDGDSTTVQEILRDNSLYKILSDESGPMLQPTYIIDPNIPETPRSFGLNVGAEGTVKLVVSADESVDNYNLYVSQDGLNFSLYNSFNSNEIILDGFEEYSILYVKLNAQNDHGISIDSEVLAVTPLFNPESHVLIVNGFDRTSEGNTSNFIRQHGSALFKSNVSFSSATNDALTTGLFEMTDYKLVDYILGEESTADETFSYSEQQLVKNFLESGGRLFVSGSEIAWDIDYKGNSTDKAFMRDYLKARYSADAPGGIGGKYYSAEGLPDGIFSGIGDIKFDNGTHGTFDVDWADALLPEEGAVSIAKYKNVSSHNIGGISYEGVFGESEIPGKLVYIGFPFETIYPEETRNSVMSTVLNYLSSDITSTEGVYSGSPDKYSISQNYPNPFNPTTKISFSIPERNNVQLKIFDILGRKISTLINEEKPAGTYEVELDGSSLSSGVYFYQIKSGKYSDIKKMLLLK